ncbi:hypothetical protein KJ742_02825, partial [Patescibacteria group bacterium]|nr:hypothetical protein [Patescibacteria group bacterium]
AIKSADKVAAKGELDEATALFKKKFGKEPVIPSADADTYIKPALAGFEPLEEPDWDSEQDVRDLIEDIKQDLKVARKSGMGVGDLEKDLAAVEEYFARSFKKPVKKKAPATAVSTAAPTTAPAPTTTPATAPAATPVTTSVAPTAPTATPTTAPATPTMDLPEDMPQVMKDVVTEVIAGDSRLEAVFGTAWALYKGLARTSVLDDEQLATIRNHFQELERTAEHPLMPADRKAAKVKSDMEKAMADISGILDRKTRRAIAEDVGRRRTLRTYSTQAPILKGELDSLVTEEDVQKRLDEMFGILELDPALFGKNADFVRKFQEGVRGVLFEDVPKKLLKRDVKDLAERVQSVGGMDIWEAATKGKDLKDIVMADRIDGIFGLFERRVGKSVADFIANPPTAEPAEEVVPAEAYEEEPELELELDEDTTPAAPAAPTPTATAAPAVAPVAAARPRRAAAEPLPDTTTRPRRAPDSMTGPRLQREISKIMNEVLSDPQLFKPDSDPVSRAIQVLITREVTEGRLDLDELKGFLQKPGAIVNARVNELVDNNNRTQLKQLLTRTRREQNKLKDDIDDARSQKTKDRVKLSTDELSALDGQIDDLRTRLNESEDEITRITTAIDLKAGNLRYKSTMQALSMIRLHIAQESGESPSDLGIMQDVDNLIAQQTEAIYKQGFLNKAGRVVYEFLTVGGLFKPTLNETLITLGKKAPEFESIGPEKMAVLAKSWNNETGVQSWIDGLKDNVDVKMTKTVPALIAYLEAALRNGNITYVNGNSLATFEGLIKHLKTARHNYITDKVADKIGPDMDDVDRMKLYFQELQRATIDQSKIDLRVIRNAGWGRGAVKTLGSAGVLGLAAGATAIGGPLTGALAAVGLAGGAVSGYKSIADADPKKKEMYGRVTKRALATTSIMCGAAAIGGGLSTVALPAILGGATLSAALPISLLAGSALGIGGVFSPELYQYREQIKKAAGVGGKGAYLFGRGAVRFASIPLSPILISRYGFINYLKWWGGGKMKG